MANSWEDNNSSREEEDLILNESDLSPLIADELEREIDVYVIDTFERRLAINQEREQADIQESRERFATVLPNNLRIVAPDFISPQCMLIAGWRIYLRNEQGVVIACHLTEILSTPRNFGGLATGDICIQILQKWEEISFQLCRYRYGLWDEEVKAARKGKASASDSETEDTRQGPGPSNQFNSEPDNPTLTSEGIGRRNIFSDIFTVTPNPSARDNINPLFGELNQSQEAGTAEGEQELDPAGSTARIRVGWDPNPVPSEGPDWNSIPSWRDGGTPEGNTTPGDTPRSNPRGTPGNTPESPPRLEGLPIPTTIPDPVVIPDPPAIPVVIPDPAASPVSPTRTIPTIPLSPIRIPPLHPVLPVPFPVPPPSVPAAPTRVPSTVPINPFVNPWVQPTRVP
ncbi:hypothetical protein R1sor_002589 [Riccia sorocarpa]|uniref:Uncharacterized protein n=1 Tax=Riccia sorocarpa TaxID=122646 RepID=A0ABD3H1V4_9MARC